MGLAWLRGPCTTYAVMKELSTSGSSYYRSRAGTAYSVVKRLIGFGLLAIEGDQITVTPAGERALQAWVGPAVPPYDVAHSADLIRLRFFYLGVLEPEDRVRFVDKSLVSLREFLSRTEELIRANEEIGDYYGALATVSLVLETQARIQWLELVRKWVVDPLPTDWAETLIAATRELRNA